MRIDYILLVDDNSDHIQSIKHLLKVIFTTKAQVYSGRKEIGVFTNPDDLERWLALPITSRSGTDPLIPDIIFLDLSFDMVSSNKDGFDAVSLLRANPKTKNCRIVACTGNAIEEQDILHLGFSYLMKKPITIDKLILALQI